MRQEMFTEHETPAGSLDNVPRFINCQKIQEKHWIQQYSKSASPRFTQDTLWSYSSTLEEHLKSIMTAQFFHGKFPPLSSNRTQQAYSMVNTNNPDAS